MFFSFRAQSQTVNPANQKFSVYKIDVNPNAIKEGMGGIAVVFSCEYKLSDAEYNGMKDAQGKVRMTFYAAISDAANEPAYQAYDFAGHKKYNNYVAVHFADETVLMPQNKSQGLRSTGMELFIPFAQTSLPEGKNNIKLALNAYNEKAGRFEKIIVKDVVLNKPATYAVSVQPRQIVVIDKAGKRTEAGRLEQDIFMLPGTRKDAKDIASFANVDLNDALQFTYCEGDAVRLKVQRSTGTGVVRLNKPRLLRTRDGKAMPAFDNATALAGEWTLDTKAAAKTATLKNGVLEMVLGIEKYRVPAVQLSAFKVNPFATHQGVAGTSISFDYKAAPAAGAPPLTAWLAYQAKDAETVRQVRNGKITGGQAKTDSLGMVFLDKNATGGKLTVFYPAYQILLQDPDVRKQPAKRFSLQIHLGNNPYVIARKEATTDLTIQTIREAALPVALKLKDTLVGGVNGAAMSLPYTLPELYFDTKEQKYLEIAEGGKEGKAVELLRRMTLADDAVKCNNPSAKTSVSYELAKPKSAVRLFLPYTSLNKIEEKPLAIRIAAHVSDGTNRVPVGESIASLQFMIDRAKLRFVAVTVASIKLKKAESGVVAWRIRSKDKILYESKPVPAEKLIENLYTDAFYIHEDDTLIVEMLRGENAQGLKPMVRWQKPVKALTAGEQIEIDPGKQPNNPDDGDTKSVTISYTAQ